MSGTLERVAGDGERHLPALNPESINHYRHLTAYHFSVPHCRAQRVLDYGCGSGYGTNLIFRRAQPARIVGMDVSIEALGYCQRSYGDLAGHFVAVTPQDVPARNESFDMALLFQTIEHVRDDLGLIRELHRVLVPGGCLFLTTPNVAWSGGDPLNPINPHHVREYDGPGLAAICTRVFTHVDKLFVHGSFRAGGGGVGAERFRAFRALRWLVRPWLPKGTYRAPVSLADFSVAASGQRRALDLLFVCHKGQ